MALQFLEKVVVKDQAGAESDGVQLVVGKPGLDPIAERADVGDRGRVAFGFLNPAHDSLADQIAGAFFDIETFGAHGVTWGVTKGKDAA